MNCIPSALVTANWEALAAWAGAAVSCVVVWSAFAIQRRQRLQDRAERNSALYLTSTNGLRSVVNTINAIRRTVQFCATPASNPAVHIDDLERELRVVDFLLSHPMPDYGTLEYLVEVGADGKWLLERLRAWPTNAHEAFFSTDSKLDIRAWAEPKESRWSEIDADARARVAEIARDVETQEKVLGD